MFETKTTLRNSLSLDVGSIVMGLSMVINTCSAVRKYIVELSFASLPDCIARATKLIANTTVDHPMGT